MSSGFIATSILLEDHSQPGTAGVVVSYKIPILVTRVRFPGSAQFFQLFTLLPDLQLLQEFQRYRELVKRPTVSRELMPERSVIAHSDNMCSTSNPTSMSFVCVCVCVCVCVMQPLPSLCTGRHCWVS